MLLKIPVIRYRQTSLQGKTHETLQGNISPGGLFDIDS